MTQKTTFTVKYRRRRKSRTNYKKRLRLLLSGKPRIVVRKQSNQLTIQLAEFAPTGDRIIATINSSELKKHGWKYNCRNLPAAYLTGLLFGKIVLKKLKKNSESTAKAETILDIGLQPSIKGSRIYAAVKGARDTGLKLPCSEDMLPSESRIKGQHIVEHAKKAEPHKTQFSKVKVNNLITDFEEIKKKILKE